MSTPFIGEIRLFSGSYAPQGWVYCEGQRLLIADYQALYTVIGSLYGTRDQTQFSVPDLRGAAPLHPGKGQGLTAYAQGQSLGASDVTLTVAQMGTHSHSAYGVENSPNTTTPEGSFIARAVNRDETRFQSSADNLVNFAGVSEVGAGQAHNNMQPYLALRYMMAYEGTYPPHG